jgi:hypothetical protein
MIKTVLGSVIESQFPFSRRVLVPVTPQFTLLFPFALLQFILISKVALDFHFESKCNISLCEIGEINVFMDSFVDMP